MLEYEDICSSSKIIFQKISDGRLGRRRAMLLLNIDVCRTKSIGGQIIWRSAHLYAADQPSRALVLGTRSHRGLHEYMFANSMIPLLRQLKRTRGKLPAGFPESSRPRHCYSHHHHPSPRYRAELACALKCCRRGRVV